MYSVQDITLRELQVTSNKQSLFLVLVSCPTFILQSYAIVDQSSFSLDVLVFSMLMGYLLQDITLRKLQITSSKLFLFQVLVFCPKFILQSYTMVDHINLFLFAILITYFKYLQISNCYFGFWFLVPHSSYNYIPQWIT